MKRAVFLFLLIAGTARADALPEVFAHPASVEQLRALLGPASRALAQAAAVRGEFRSRKFLRELPQPLTASGDFLVARGLGLVWHTRAPFDAELTLTPQALVQRDAGGAPLRIDAAQLPGLGAVVQVFDALFALDLQRLAAQFELYGARRDKGWTLGLKPRAAAMAQRLNAVVIEGVTQPQQVVLYEAGGDRTQLEFSGQTLLEALPPDARAQLAP
ncbi:MAG: outer membrane lipoprotein carrier protein LolA [Sinobacteraceae bacterium]|nr:outer membrane lipoprotein carrier protein LolA [Nevskiaceae bacterium]